MLTARKFDPALTMAPRNIRQSRRFMAAILSGSITLIVLYILWVSFRSSSRLAVCWGACKTIEIDPATPPTVHANESLETNIIKNKVAVIVENRPLDRIVPLLLHFSTVLGYEWPIFLFTSQDIIPDSAPLKRLIDERLLTVRFLPPDVIFNSRLDVSGFLTKTWLWEQLAPAEHVLMFQSDSILCSNSPLKMDEFLKYDFVGAPIAENFGEGYNGGLSLRNRSMILDIIRYENWGNEYKEAENKQQQDIEFEDQWFYTKMKGLPEQGKPAAKLPSKEVAMTFSVETIWYDKPLGYHQVARWQPDKIDAVNKWCPEYRLAISELFQ